MIPCSLTHLLQQIKAWNWSRIAWIAGGLIGLLLLTGIGYFVVAEVS